MLTHRIRILLLALSAVTFTSTISWATSPDPEAEAAQDKPEGLPLEDLRRFVDVYDRIKKAYVEKVDDKTLLNNAIRGMLTGLDPHSAYLEPTAFEDLQESTTGEFGGLGIEVGQEDGFIKVIAPIDDTPAHKAGIQAGDLIIKIDDETTKGISLDEAVKRMRGAPGTDITLTIVREGESAPIDITITRDVIRVRSVKSTDLGEGFAAIRITQFQAQTGVDFTRALEKLIEANDGKLKGLVIDLRNNPGGILQSAVDVVDALLDEGLIVYTEGRIKSSKLRFVATPGDLMNGAPVVVLINGGSASASEIVSGALQDHRRALIMGTQSFGKGSVQTILPLDGDYGLKLTTARYYTPSGRSIQAKGITPDIEVGVAKITEVKDSHFIKEAELSGHLENGDKSNSTSNESNGPDNEVRKLLERDFQLREAVNLLKGLSIMQAARAERNETLAPETVEAAQ